MVETSTSSSAWLLTELRAALSLLSAPADAQLRHLADLGLADAVDELALEFDDVAPALGNLITAKAVTTESADAVRRLDEQLSAMSGVRQSGLWTPQALRTFAEWDEVRRLAARALELLSSADEQRTRRSA